MPAMANSGGDSLEAPSGRMILSMMRDPMIPGLEGVRPAVGPFVPGSDRKLSQLPRATPTTRVILHDGDTLTLVASIVRRTIAGRTLAAYAFNGQTPGPLIQVGQGSTFYVRLRNEIDRPATIHWHGIRLANASDGAPVLTQIPVAPGGAYLYAVHCPDAGIFWYHDHVREDIGQPMGLYGNIDVEPAPTPAPAPAATGSAPRDAFLILSDVLLDSATVVPFGLEAPNFALMGRFGNILLINGEPRWHFQAAPGEVVRLLLTNAASARTFNLSFGDARIKLVASDQGRYAREVMVPSVVIAPGERYVVDVRFDAPGTVAVVNAVQTVDHFLGEIFSNVDTLGQITVAGPRAAGSAGAFATLHEDAAVAADIARFRSAFDRAPDQELVLTTEIHGLPIPVMQFMSIDTVYRPPLEWTDGMADMNWIATGREVRWVLRDARTGAENMQIAWHYPLHAVVKLRVYNDPRSLHPMDHPLHLHGQRFLVIARDGRPNPYLVWKDTAIIPVGSTVDLLLDLSNPGTWMLHCHIAEHMESGMMMSVVVDAN
jgi:suppressor of ftsI